ncbi:Bacterial Transmembrane Pair family protein [Polystyrenella longa]|uniref:Bacterial Transmembrane Pair family protein n=1 Tax=Polystyrenella longa TaxID=2528007 RepID=A0A518CS31_9PLAN|nr:PACE efflux transporter [Polystyrenella longa]QDU82037.1 Bacterial Transmembrane Pair family protein [Polystyrenella longa]
MRDTKDRIRHAILFEIIGLLIVTPLGAWAFEMPLHHAGIVGVINATIAMLWNYVYNFLFDHAMLRIYKNVRKSPSIRVLHAVLFEAGLLAILIPVIAWHLGITLQESFVLEASFSVFFLVYAFVYNWVYDVIFPIPMPEETVS